ncbi:MAG: hypothetical protein M3362_24460, partial [Acidobacteriota bacterium]|nr:hypothetical protein [Acidobacteriota bacterium]
FSTPRKGFSLLAKEISSVRERDSSFGKENSFIQEEFSFVGKEDSLSGMKLSSPEEEFSSHGEKALSTWCGCPLILPERAFVGPSST